MEDSKSRGAQKYKNKKKNTGGVGHGRSDIYQSKRGQIKSYDRYTHHTYRQALDDGIAKGAQENWLPPTSGGRKQKSFWPIHKHESFNKWRYRGEICHMLPQCRHDNKDEWLQELTDLVADSPKDLQKIDCRRCRYYYQMLRELPSLESVADIRDVKELYRDRNIRSKFDLSDPELNNDLNSNDNVQQVQFY